MQYLTSKKLQTQTMYPTRDREVKLFHQTGTLYTKNSNRGNLLKTHDSRHAQGDIGMTLSLNPSQAFVQDPEGKPHVLLFHPKDSIAKNLLRHSPQLHLPPLAELYILSGSHIIQEDRTGIVNGLHHEPH